MLKQVNRKHRSEFITELCALLILMLCFSGSALSFPLSISDAQKFNGIISAGSSHSVRLRSDGTVVATGDNECGQLNVSSWRDIVAVAAGGDHTVGLRLDGSVVATGMNTYGQLDVSSWRDIVVVAAGPFHTVGLKSDGTVVAVGWNNYGQLNVSSWRDIVAIAAGQFHTVGLKSDGTVVAVGRKTEGQLDVSIWRDIVAVAAGDLYTIGLKSDGTMVAIGNNYYGQLDVSIWSNIVAVAAGGQHTIGLRSDGRVVAVGRNYEGQLNVYFWRNIVAVAAGDLHTIGLKSDGTMAAVGRNLEEQLNVSNWATSSGDYTVSGTIKDTSGKAIPNVKVTTGSKLVYTDSSGEYRIEDLTGTNILTPSTTDGYSFSPGQLTASGPMSNLDFIAFYEIRGYIRDEDSNGIEGIEVITGDKKTITDNKGQFTLSGLSGKNDISFKKEGYTFDPATKNISGPASNIVIIGIAPPLPIIYSYASNYNIERVTIDGTPKACPRLSPNGQMLAYASAGINMQGIFEWSIYAIRFGQQGTLTVSGVKNTNQPTWLPTSERIVYVHSGLADKPLLVTQSYRGGSISFISLTPIGDFTQYPDVASKGDNVVFQTRMQGKDYVFTMGMDGSNQRLITEGIQPRWSPAGTSILFSRKVGIYYHITMLNENDEMSQLTQGEYDNLFPCWSPDGEWVSFISKMDGKYHLYVMRSDGTNLTQLTKGEAEAFYCEWGSDGWLYFVSDAGSPSAKIRDPWRWTYSDIWRIQPTLPK